jgi:indolepyruvate ferredoxin oxidoreductase beta subunit
MNGLVVDRHNGHGWRILLAGTGGQGVLTAARLLCNCFVDGGHEVVSGQLHGMAQRGGVVQSSVIIDAGISPVIPEGRADFVVGLEPTETARAMPYMSSDTRVLMNTARVVPFVVAQGSVFEEEGVGYPDVVELVERVRGVTPHTFAFDATQCAAEAGSRRAVNMVMLGALMGLGMLPLSAEEVWASVSDRVPQALRETNARAFRQGATLAAAFQVGGRMR